ncbi:Uncharacterised protein [Achromobacter xylosoxidans]|nr:Uncharacterised protein [Achromobacter xylosoxidans]
MLAHAVAQGLGLAAQLRRMQVQSADPHRRGDRAPAPGRAPARYARRRQLRHGQRPGWRRRQPARVRGVAQWRGLVRRQRLGRDQGVGAQPLRVQQAPGPAHGLARGPGQCHIAIGAARAVADRQVVQVAQHQRFERAEHGGIQARLGDGGKLHRGGDHVARMQHGFTGGLGVGLPQGLQRQFALTRAAPAAVEPGVGQRRAGTEFGERGQRDAQGIFQGFSLVQMVSGAVGGALRIKACIDTRARS